MAKFTDLPLSEQRRLIKESSDVSLSDIITAYDKENVPQPSGPSLTTTLPFSLENAYKSGGKIHIKPENRGKFTALKKRTGHSASWFKAHGTPAQKKMAVFALNSKHWSHKRADGGYLQDYGQSYELGGVYDLSEEQVQELIRQGYEVERI